MTSKDLTSVVSGIVDRLWPVAFRDLPAADELFCVWLWRRDGCCIRRRPLLKLGDISELGYATDPEYTLELLQRVKLAGKLDFWQVTYEAITYRFSDSVLKIPALQHPLLSVPPHEFAGIAEVAELLTPKLLLMRPNSSRERKRKFSELDELPDLSRVERDLLNKLRKPLSPVYKRDAWFLMLWGNLDDWRVKIIGRHVRKALRKEARQFRRTMEVVVNECGFSQIRRSRGVWELKLNPEKLLLPDQIDRLVALSEGDIERLQELAKPLRHLASNGSPPEGGHCLQDTATGSSPESGHRLQDTATGSSPESGHRLQEAVTGSSPESGHRLQEAVTAHTRAPSQDSGKQEILNPQVSGNSTQDSQGSTASAAPSASEPDPLEARLRQRRVETGTSPPVDAATIGEQFVERCAKDARHRAAEWEQDLRSRFHDDLDAKDRRRWPLARKIGEALVDGRIEPEAVQAKIDYAFANGTRPSRLFASLILKDFESELTSD